MFIAIRYMYIVESIHIKEHSQENDNGQQSALRHKHIQLNQAKLDRARKILGTSTETGTPRHSLDIVSNEADIDGRF